MRFASIREFRFKATAILEKTRADESVIVTKRGKPVAVLIPVAEAMLDGVLRAVQGARLKASVEEARREAGRAGAKSLDAGQIDAQIRKARAGRRG